MLPKKVMIVAGEASGDMHAANLVRAVKARTPDVRFFGIGGPLMRAEGVETLVDSRTMAVVGVVEVLAHFGTIYGALRLMRRKLEEERPDLLIVVDYPDFNLKVAKSAKALGIKVLYYISPQVWAWREGRVATIKQRVDTMAVVFPFEVPFYERAGVPVRFVGHPLVEEVGSALSGAEARSSMGLDPSRKVLGLFPGSRHGELKRILPVLLDSAEVLKRRHPDLQFLLPRASSLSEADLAPYLAGRDVKVTVVANRSYDVMRACDAIVAASGTVTLEIALMEIPLVVIYRVAPLTYSIMRRLIRVKQIALCNIVAEEEIAKELIQDAASPPEIIEEAERLLFDDAVSREMRQRLALVRHKLGAGGGSQNIAELALEMLKR